MWRKVWLSGGYLLILLPASTGYTENSTRPAPPPAVSSPAPQPHTPTAESRRPAPIQRPIADLPKAEDLDSLVKQLKEIPNAKETAGVLDAWWTAAQGVLDALEKKEPAKAKEAALKIASELATGKRKDLFTEFVSARFIDDPAKLRKWALDPNFTPEKREAGKQEIRRRLTDANVKLLSELFHMRPEMAMLFADKLLKLIKNTDPKEAGPIVAKMMGTLNETQRKSLQQKTQALQGKEKERGLDARLVKWLNEASAKSIGAEVKGSPFVDEFDKAYQKVRQGNKRFYDLLANANGADPKAAAEAKKQLLAEYDPESVMDFISGQLAGKNDGVAVDTARAFARQDDKGDLFLLASARNAAFADKDQDQEIYLGNRDKLEEVRAALQAVQAGADHTAGEVTQGFDPQTKDRFHLFRVQDPALPPANPKRVYAEERGGNPMLAVRSDPGRPKGKIATQPVEVASTPPQATPATIPDGTTPKEGTTPPATGGVDLASLRTGIKKSCNGCHAASLAGDDLKSARVHIGTGATQATASDILTAIAADRGGMGKLRGSAIEAKIKAWAAQQ